MLTAEQIDNWVDALNSGKIPQGQGALCRESGAMCCLGVLAKTLGAEFHKIELMDHPEPYMEVTIIGSERFVGFLPESIMTLSMQNFFAQLNDNKKLSFLEIAEKVIENKERLMYGSKRTRPDTAVS